MQAIQKIYARMDPNVRNAMWIAISLALGFLAMAINLLPDLRATNTLRAYLANYTPFAMIIISLTSATLYWTNRVRTASTVLLAGTAFLMLLIPFVAEGYALITGLVTFVIFAAISAQLYRTRFIYFVYAGGIIIVINLLVDRFWPFIRQGLDTDVIVGQVIGIILLFLVGLVVWRQLALLRLQDKLIMFAITITIIPLFAVNSFTQAQTEQALVKSANESLLGSASQVAYALDTFLNHTMDNIRTEASLNDVVEYLSLPPDERNGSDTEGHVKEILSALERRDPENIISYALLDTQGYDVFDLDPQDIGLDLSDQDYFLVPMRTRQPYVSAVEVIERTGKIAIHITAPVFGESGETVGVIRLRYDAGIIQKILQDNTAQLSPNVSTLVVDDKHIVIGNTKEISRLYQSITPLTYSEWSLLVNQLRLPEKPFEESFYNLPDVDQAMEDPTQSPLFTGEVHAGGTSLEYAAIARTETQPWTLVAAIDADTLLAPVEIQTKNGLLAGIIAAVIAVGVAVFVSGLIAAPINRLTSVAEKVAEGDLRARAWVETKDEIGVLAATFNSMTEQLQQTLETLEQRITDRTRAIETSAVVGRRLSTVLDEQQLVKAVVDELQQSFKYYHVQMYLLEEDVSATGDVDNRVLHLVGGTGEAGRVMIENHHKIPYGKGLVGRAAESGTVVFVSDTRNDPSWLPNPLLPDTCAELAVPILIGDEILGAIDIQHNEEGELGQQDIDLLQSICGQVAVTLRNSRLYEEARQQANRETLIASIIAQIQQTQSVEQALKVAAREIGRSVGGHPTLIRLYRSQTNVSQNIQSEANNSLGQPD